MNIKELLSPSDLIAQHCACGSQNGTILNFPDRHNLKALTFSRCSNCSSVFQSYYPTFDWISDFYQNHYQLLYKRNTAGVKRKQELRAYDIVKAFPSLVDSNINIFEFGSSHGITLLKLARLLNVSSYSSYEPSSSQHTSFHRNSKSYDFIYSNHVLEHTYNPSEFINTQFNMLADDGIILNIIPDDLMPASSYVKNLKLYGKRIPFIYKSYKSNLLHLAHKYLFTTKCLSIIADKLSVNVVSFRVKLPNSFPEIWTIWSSTPTIQHSSFLSRYIQSCPYDYNFKDTGLKLLNIPYS